MRSSSVNHAFLQGLWPKVIWSVISSWRSICVASSEHADVRTRVKWSDWNTFILAGHGSLWRDMLLWPYSWGTGLWWAHWSCPSSHWWSRCESHCLRSTWSWHELYIVPMPALQSMAFSKRWGGIPFHPKSFRYLWLVSYLFMSLPIKCRHQSIMIHDSTTLHVWNGINGYSWGFPILVTAMAAVSAGVAQRSSLDFFRGCWMISSPSKRVSFGARRFTLMPGWRGKPWEKGWGKGHDVILACDVVIIWLATRKCSDLELRVENSWTCWTTQITKNSAWMWHRLSGCPGSWDCRGSAAHWPPHWWSRHELAAHRGKKTMLWPRPDGFFWNTDSSLPFDQFQCQAKQFLLRRSWRVQPQGVWLKCRRWKTWLRTAL